MTCIQTDENRTRDNKNCLFLYFSEFQSISVDHLVSNMVKKAVICIRSSLQLQKQSKQLVVSNDLTIAETQTKKKIGKTYHNILVRRFSSIKRGFFISLHHRRTLIKEQMYSKEYGLNKSTKREQSPIIHKEQLKPAKILRFQRKRDGKFHQRVALIIKQITTNLDKYRSMSHRGEGQQTQQSKTLSCQLLRTLYLYKSYLLNKSRKLPIKYWLEASQLKITLFDVNYQMASPAVDHQDSFQQWNFQQENQKIVEVQVEFYEKSGGKKQKSPYIKPLQLRIQLPDLQQKQKRDTSGCHNNQSRLKMYMPFGNLIFVNLTNNLASYYGSPCEIYTPFSSNLNFLEAPIQKSSCPLPSTNEVIPLSQQPIRESLRYEKQVKMASEGKIRRKREKNVERELISARKNSESNLINHYFTWYTNRDWSQRQVRRIICSLGQPKETSEKLLPFFYYMMRLINLKRGRKYINVDILASFFSEKVLNQIIPDLPANLHIIEPITISDLSGLLRRSLRLFLNDDSICSLLTSKRLSRLSKAAHLEKRRKVLKFYSNKQVKK